MRHWHGCASVLTTMTHIQSITSNTAALQNSASVVLTMSSVTIYHQYSQQIEIVPICMFIVH